MKELKFTGYNSIIRVPHNHPFTNKIKKIHRIPNPLEQYGAIPLNELNFMRQNSKNPQNA
ncbi:hypothetical protein [Staphylococcus aureus]|uniref:hypothetical protein n=1 Tax=Staphylococcus aureus TaxID=1280 RepID=UPI0021B15484|nr:hypothetical protein [Staphylococcus aureus]